MSASAATFAISALLVTDIVRLSELSLPCLRLRDCFTTKCMYIRSEDMRLDREYRLNLEDHSNIVMMNTSSTNFENEVFPGHNSRSTHGSPNSHQLVGLKTLQQSASVNTMNLQSTNETCTECFQRMQNQG